MYKRSILLAALLLSTSCGGGGGGGGGSGVNLNTPTPGIESGPNVMSIVVDTGPVGATPNVNVPYVTVTICVPGTTSCQTIDHVLLDTGSYGLRILASEVSPLLVLPQQTTSGGVALAECSLFFSGYAWGGVRLADVTLASETASSVPIEIIGDSAFPATAPTSCSSAGAIGGPMNSVSALGAKGILGVGPLKQDCAWCVSSATDSMYYTCPSGTCSPVTLELARQVTNPVAMLPTNNNGIVVYFPSVPAGGAATVTGAMALGIGTQSNNTLGAATIFDVNSSGNFTTTYSSTSLPAFFDTGSNGLFFPSGITQCTLATGFYCPSSTIGQTAVIRGATSGISMSVSFTIANIESLSASAPTYVAFGNVGGYLSGYFDWGLPFHYGRKVFTAIDGQPTPAGNGPYVAF